jgi:hypothetical protein
VLLRSKGVVVSDRGKVIREGWQVRIGKMSESKLADDASLRINILSKPGLTTGSGTSRDDTCLHGPVGSRCIGGMSPIQALIWNVRTFLRMQREMTNGRHHEEECRCRSEGRSRECATQRVGRRKGRFACRIYEVSMCRIDDSEGCCGRSGALGRRCPRAAVAQ